MPDSFVLTNNKGKILRVNQATTDLLGYKEKELTDTTIHQFFSDNIQLINEITEKHEIKSLETKIVTKQGVQKPISISASQIKDKRGKKLGITIIIHDLTLHKIMEEKIVKNQRLAAIGELAGMVGHDLRNPLTSIQGATYYIKTRDGKNLNENSKKMLETIERSIQYSNKIVNDLLDYSGEIRLELEDVNIKSLTSAIFELVHVPQKVKLYIFADNCPTIQVDTNKITRVFVNFIKNAIEAMPDGGTLTIKSIQTKGNLEVSFED